MVRDTWPRQHYARHQWSQDRFAADPPPDDSRYHEPADARRQPPLAIEKALRDHCNIRARHYFVAVILDDGSEETFSGSGRYHPDVVARFFNMDAYRGQARRVDSGICPMDDSELRFGNDPYRQQYSSGSGYGSSIPERRRQDTAFLDDEPAFRSRKRSRMYRRPGDDDDNDDMQLATVGAARRSLRIGNDGEVWDFYDQRFRNCQQTACKLIAKAWVKVVEPKKQTNHPYTGSDERAPDWWPKPWGATKEEKVRHKEPDHLYKRERVHLLCHILRMVVEPRDKQHPAIQKLGLNVDKLKEATDEALSLFFSGKENEKNAKKRPYLDEMFKIARFEQRYKNGEIDGDTGVMVMAEDKFPENSENDDGSAPRDEGEPPSGPASASPAKAPIPPDGLMHGGHGHDHDHSPTGHLQPAAFMGEVPVRPSSQYSTPMPLPPQIHADQHFVENSAMSTSAGMPLHEMVPNTQHESHRRSLLYTSPTEYANPPSAAGLYNQSWSAGASGPPGPAPMYAFPQQPAPSTAGHFSHPMAQGHYMNAPYDAGLPRGSFDQETMFRPPTSTSAGHAPPPAAQAYSGYIGPDGRSVPGPGVKAESLPRGHIP